MNPILWKKDPFCQENIPVFDETVAAADVSTTKNTSDAAAWTLIESDLSFAYSNLPETQSQLGRVNKWAAASLLAKAYLYQKKYSEANGLMLRNTAPVNLLGLCAITIPITLDGSGIPVGMQLIAPAFNEIKLLSIALKIENLLGNKYKNLA